MKLAGEDLPAEPHTEIRVTWNETDGLTSDLVLDESGCWCEVQSEQEYLPERLAAVIDDYEVLAVPFEQYEALQDERNSLAIEAVQLQARLRVRRDVLVTALRTFPWAMSAEDAADRIIALQEEK